MIRRLPPTLVTIVPVPSERASETTAIADDGERAIAITPQNNAVHALHLTWMAQRTKAGQARPLMRAILDHVVRAGSPLAPAHARCTALAYKLIDAQ